MWNGSFNDGEMHVKFEIFFTDGDIIDAVYVDVTSIKSEYRDKLKPTKFSKKI